MRSGGDEGIDEAMTDTVLHDALSLIAQVAGDQRRVGGIPHG
jgi:hypothetical protein